MITRRWLLFYPLLGVLFLSGCGFTVNVAELKREEIMRENALVESTLSSYYTNKEIAEEKKDALLRYALYGVKSDQLFSSSFSDDGSEEALASEKDPYAIVYDKYFTALGATSLREIIVMNFEEKVVYINALWDKEGLVWLDKKVYPT